MADLDGWTPYTFLAQPGSTPESMPSWPRMHGQFPVVHGYSRLGHLFLSDTDHRRFCVLYPLQGSAKAYRAGSVAEFRRTVTDDPSFQAWIFPPNRVRAIVEHVGPITDDDVYIPVPYPMLGGSDEPDTYSFGNVWVFLDLVGQVWLSQRSQA